MESGILTALPYVGVASLLGIYGLHRMWMVLRFRWPVGGTPPTPARWPTVTVQLPVFNERTVAERLVRAAGELDYPRESLEIQVLDDSTDETSSIVDEAVARLRARGMDAKALRRPTREGYKAGALDHGMRVARGELICVFDADFLPERSFLRNLVGHFENDRVGMVQARWGHANRDESLLTRAVSTLLDGHFVIEHTVRYAEKLFFNFNGTAGIWRRAAIEAAGGWQHDTLTEDLDLSYRAQLAGWDFVYMPSEVAPAEVPANIAAFKTQQHRWAKGSVQVARKLGARILSADQPLRVKLEALAHLGGNAGYPLVLALAGLLPLAVFDYQNINPWVHALLFLLCTATVFVFYAQSQRPSGRPTRTRTADILAAVVLGIGMCVSQTRAVVAGLFGSAGEFVRTPKRGDSDSVRPYRVRLAELAGLEWIPAVWLLWGTYGAVRAGLWGAVPFLLLFFTGFAWVGTLSLRHWLCTRQPGSADADCSKVSIRTLFSR